MPARKPPAAPEPTPSAPKNTTMQAVTAAIDNRMDQLTALFGGDAGMAERMKYVALHALAHPKLLEKLQRSDPATIIEAIRESAALGLMPIPATAEGYLVPRWNQDKGKYDITFMPGYRGYVKLMYQNKRVASIRTGVVYEKDAFEFEQSEGYIRHVPVLSERGQVVATWAKAVILTDGHTESQIVVLNEDQIAKIMKSSASRDGKGNLVGPWIEWPDAMRAKSALRELRKTTPMSYESEQAEVYEARIDDRYGRDAIALPDGQSKNARLLSAARDRLPSSVDSGESPEPETPTGTVPGTPAAQEGNGGAPGDLSPDDEAAVWRAIDEKDTPKA